MPNPVSAGLPNPSSYEVDEVNGVVVDLVTKLMWQREVDSNAYNWADAKAYCDGLTHAGHDDWRLPTRIEITSLGDFTKTNPTIDAVALPDTPSEWFWISSPWAGSGSTAWLVAFDYGNANYGDVADSYRVRCVR
jgi:hypothetical protein